MPRKARKPVSEETVRIRERFHEAIHAGMSIAEATAYANGLTDKPQLNFAATAAKPKPSAPPIEPTWIDNGNQPSAFAEVEEAPPAPKAEPAASTQPEIPENIDELPWAQLRSLAHKCGLQNINSRKEAVAALKAHRCKE